MRMMLVIMVMIMMVMTVIVMMMVHDDSKHVYGLPGRGHKVLSLVKRLLAIFPTHKLGTQIQSRSPTHIQ